jgi:hypothetical protein
MSPGVLLVMCVVIFLFLSSVPCVIVMLYALFPWQILMKKFVALGTECAEYLKSAKAFEGSLLSFTLLVSTSFFASLSYSFFLFFTIDALAIANARIASLEAELEVSRRAFDAATAAKTNAEKSSESALDKAKKMEKSLTDLKKERTQ